MAEENEVSGCGIRSFRSQVMKEAWRKTGGADISFAEFGKLVSESYKEMKAKCGI